MQLEDVHDRMTRKLLAAGYKLPGQQHQKDPLPPLSEATLKWIATQGEPSPN